MSKNLKYGLIGGGIFVVVVIVIVIAFVPWLTKSGLENTGYQKEENLNALFKKEQSTLSSCITRVKQTVQANQAQNAALDKILTDTMEGRRQLNAGAEGGSLFSAIQEAYPDLDQLGPAYQDLRVVINGCYTDFDSAQAQMQDAIAEYNSWRRGGRVKRYFADVFPSDGLVAQVGGSSGQTYKGQEALDIMGRVILDSAAGNSFNTGDLDTGNPFDTTTVPG